MAYMTIDKLLKKEIDSVTIVSNLSLALIVLGESMQIATGIGVMNYNWFTGHLSDFGISSQTTAMGIGLTSGKNKYLRAAANFLPATICTIHEFYPLYPGEGVFDPQDIALYWIGAGVAHGGIKFLSSDANIKRTKQFFNRINPLNLYS